MNSDCFLVGQAHGLCFRWASKKCLYPPYRQSSVRPGVTVPPSLLNIYKELSTDIDGFQVPKHGCGHLSLTDDVFKDAWLVGRSRECCYWMLCWQSKHTRRTRMQERAGKYSPAPSSMPSSNPKNTLYSCFGAVMRLKRAMALIR